MAKVIATFATDEEILDTKVYNDRVFVVTNYRVFQLNDTCDALIELPFKQEDNGN